MTPGGSTPDAWPTAGTRLVGVLGHPVAHSLSPVMHNAALRIAGIDLAYVAVDVAPGDLAAAMAGLAPLGFIGANVTVPHKQAVLAACTSLSDEARLVGAVNTITVQGGELHGHNTDTAGFLGALPTMPAGRAVVLGAGGAARAVVVALARTGWDVAVVARRPEQARGLADTVDGAGGSPVDTARPGDARVPSLVAAADLVVNATPLGLHGEVLPSAFMQLASHQVAHDLVYNPPDTPFLVAARAAGATAIDGLPMLVGQAAAAFTAWTGEVADRDAMQAAARAVLDGGP